MKLCPAIELVLKHVARAARRKLHLLDGPAQPSRPGRPAARRKKFSPRTPAADPSL